MKWLRWLRLKLRGRQPVRMLAREFQDLVLPPSRDGTRARHDGSAGALHSAITLAGLFGGFMESAYRSGYPLVRLTDSEGCQRYAFWSRDVHSGLLDVLYTDVLRHDAIPFGLPAVEEFRSYRQRGPLLEVRVLDVRRQQITEYEFPVRRGFLDSLLSQYKGCGE